MAKKYLLYIHHVRFEKEKHKSKLVNELIEKHYGGLTIFSEPIGLEVDDGVNVIELEEPLKKTSYKEFRVCKHGYNPKFCKFAKGEKECK
ncbi:MAG: hypothetical protein KGI08_07105 [Thaumarchaeota archaeon]|nr:hypothetical protein [Nitrososphaerota archaeon]